MAIARSDYLAREIDEWHRHIRHLYDNNLKLLSYLFTACGLAAGWLVYGKVPILYDLLMGVVFLVLSVRTAHLCREFEVVYVAAINEISALVGKLQTELNASEVLINDLPSRSCTLPIDAYRATIKHCRWLCWFFVALWVFSIGDAITHAVRQDRDWTSAQQVLGTSHDEKHHKQ